VFTDEPFADAFGVRGAPGMSPAVLSLVTVLQFAENLTDRQAAAMAVRAIDWKYALGGSGRPALEQLYRCARGGCMTHGFLLVGGETSTEGWR
jgi:hypothetical protein